MKFFMSLLGVLAAAQVAMADANKITIYTDRPTARLKPIADRFTSETGVLVDIVEKKYSDILAQLQAEGSASPVDVIFTKDLVFLAELANKGHFQAMNSEVVKTKITENLRDPQGLWTAVSVRARTILFDPNRIKASELSSYEDLATDKWAGRLCLRTSKNSYNEALVGFLVAKYGVTKAQSIVDGWVANLAVAPFANDTSMIEAIANGQCDVALGNTYYLGQLVAANPQFPVKAFFANQNEGGVHANGAGAGIAKNSDNAASAQEFIEMLLENDVQLELTGAQFEYPAVKGLAPSTLIKDWGTFNIDPLNWSVIGNEAQAAREIMTKAGYK